MGRYRRKRVHKAIKDTKKKYRTKRRTKDLDQIQDDLGPEKAGQLLRAPPDLDLPGGGQHYCIHCSRHFINDEALKVHFKGKPHKRRLHALREPTYSQQEAEQAAGMGCYVQPPPHPTMADSVMRDCEAS